MPKKKTAHAYELELRKMIESRTGAMMSGSGGSTYPSFFTIREGENRKSNDYALGFAAFTKRSD